MCSLYRVQRSVSAMRNIVGYGVINTSVLILQTVIVRGPAFTSDRYTAWSQIHHIQFLPLRNARIKVCAIQEKCLWVLHYMLTITVIASYSGMQRKVANWVWVIQYCKLCTCTLDKCIGHNQFTLIFKLIIYQFTLCALTWHVIYTCETK